MAPSSRSGTLRAYGPPFWSDRMFWIALAIAIGVGLLAVVVLLMLLAIPRTGAGWAWTIFLGLLATWIGFAGLSIGLNTARGMERGVAEADSARGDRYEKHGRRAGRVIGKGLATMTGRGTMPDDGGGAGEREGAEAATDDAPRERTDIDRGANSLGRMVGRRLAERRARTEEST